VTLAAPRRWGAVVGLGRHRPAHLARVAARKAVVLYFYMGIERSMFVIDAGGNVAKIMRRVKPAEHADDVLAALS